MQVGNCLGLDYFYFSTLNLHNNKMFFLDKKVRMTHLSPPVQFIILKYFHKIFIINTDESKVSLPFERNLYLLVIWLFCEKNNLNT